MSNIPFAKKSPKGKPSNGTHPTGAMTPTKVQTAKGKGGSANTFTRG